MPQAPITIQLPGSGGEAILRSFVKNKDRKAIQRLSLAGTEISQEDIKDDKAQVKLQAQNMVDVTSEQVKRLLISYDGNTEDPYRAMEESEYEEDMDAVETAAQKIFDRGGDAEATAKKSKTGANATSES